MVYNIRRHWCIAWAQFLRSDYHVLQRTGWFEGILDSELYKSLCTLQTGLSLRWVRITIEPFLSWYFLGFAVTAWVLDCVAFSTKLSSREHEIAGGILSLFMSSVRTWVVALFTTSKLLPAKRGQVFSKMLPDTFWRDNPSRYGLWLMSKVCPWRHQTSACTSF